ncbi:MAG: GldG family protein [Clostridia bacterium]|nr:GldG family protein [Clostridia bacterium]
MKRNTKFGINALLVTLVTVAAVILVNAVISTIAGKVPMKIDLTRDRVYEFSEHTKEMMESLDQEIKVYALYPTNTNANEYITYAQEYLSKYEALSKNFKVTYIDPYTNPGFAKKYETQGEAISAGSMILECGDQVKVIPMEEMYTTNKYTGATSIDMEKKITAAVMQVTGKAGATKVYFVEGHDEFTSVQLATALTENGYECQNIHIGVAGIPQDAALLVVLAPAQDLTAEEIDALDRYLDGGGKALFAFEPGQQPLERLNGYLAEWGVVPRNDFVVENNPDRTASMQGLAIPIPSFEKHQITERLIERKMIYIMPSVGSLELNDQNIRHTQLTPLLTTTKDSWGKVNFASETMEKEEGDHEGPLTIAALSEMADFSGSGIMVIGSLSAIEYNGILQESSYANGDFILNAVGYLTKTENNMNIRAKLISETNLTMTQGQVALVTVLLQYVLPILIILAGLIVWLERRYR